VALAIHDSGAVEQLQLLARRGSANKNPLGAFEEAFI
jgi:hypothetical protein